jgi:hypothetical protein
VLSGREQQLAVVREVERAAVVLGGRGLGILVEDGLAARHGPGEAWVGGEPRDAIAVGSAGGVEDVVEVVGLEVGVEDDVVEALLDARFAHVGELQERIRVRVRVRGRQHVDPPGELADEHPAVGQELERGGEVEARCEDLVLEVVGVGDVDDHRG